jgi:hypothetical protein
MLPAKTAAYGNVIEASTRTPGPWDYANEATATGFPNGTWFSGAITDHAVLQKGAGVSAALYGGVYGGVSAAAKVTLTVAEKGAANYTVNADILSMNENGGDLTWKAMLKPHIDQGGSISITAQCSGCANTTATTISDLTYGDVWYVR